VLKLLASQAAIALENARLYRDVAEREAKIRRLVDANIIGIFISSRKGEIIEANDAFFKMVGYDREDLAAGNMRLTDLTPPEWRASTSRPLEGIDTTGAVQPYEKEYLRKDGSRVPVLIGSTAFDEQRDQGVAFVLDLTERKRAEAEARESEQRYRKAQLGCPSGRPPIHDGMSAMCSPAVLPPGAIWVGTHDRVSPAHSCFCAIEVIFYRWIFRWNLEPRCRCLCLTMY
jgi:PAS domain S-box-containing protein